MLELMATAANLTANAVLAHRTFHTPNGPLPFPVIGMQVFANACWMSSAVVESQDYYILATSATSFLLQTCTLYLMCLRPSQTYTACKMSTSDPSLPQFGPPHLCKGAIDPNAR